MPTKCQIKFDNNPNKIAFSGQLVHITVRLNLTGEIKVRRIYIQLRGTAHVRFVNNNGYLVRTDEIILNIKRNLTGGNDMNQTVFS